MGLKVVKKKLVQMYNMVNKFTKKTIMKINKIFSCIFMHVYVYIVYIKINMPLMTTEHFTLKKKYLDHPIKSVGHFVVKIN